VSTARTSIEWTRGDDGTAGRTWNPVTGCSKLSEGCGLPRFNGDKSGGCYAEAIARRFAGTKAFPHGFAVTPHPERLADPLRWRAPARVFVNSMSDLWHERVDTGLVARVFAVMAVAKRHTFQVLTKRPGRMRAMLADDDFWSRVTAAALELDPPPAALAAIEVRRLPNLWLGVSIELQRWAPVRLNKLARVNAAAVRFASCEPLLGPLDLRPWLGGSLHWLIAGAESGPGSRAMDPNWVRSLRDQCVDADVAFFYKQDADRHGRKIPTPSLDGRVWTQMPAAAVHS
jgi:protein gp37